MINKIYIKINVPMLQECFDILVPPSKSLDNFNYLIAKSLNELTEGYFPLKKLTIYNAKGDIIKMESNVKDAGIKYGEELIII